MAPIYMRLSRRFALIEGQKSSKKALFFKFFRNCPNFRFLVRTFAALHFYKKGRRGFLRKLVYENKTKFYEVKCEVRRSVSAPALYICGWQPYCFNQTRKKGEKSEKIVVLEQILSLYVYLIPRSRPLSCLRFRGILSVLSNRVCLGSISGLLRVGVSMTPWGSAP
jgi:hypothetical protein